MSPEIAGIDRALRGLQRLNEPQYDGMTTWGLIPLNFETRATSQLLTHAHSLLINQRPIDDHIEVLLTLLSSGIERTLKIALGYAFLDRRKGWPKDLSRYGHKIAHMNRRLFTLATRSDSSSVELRDTVDSLRSDQAFQTLFETLQRYAMGGRYHYLDQLAAKSLPSPGEGSVGAWINLLLSVENASKAPTPLDDDDLNHVHLELALILERWLACVSLMAAAGVLSRRALQFGQSVDPRILFESRALSPDAQK